MIEIISLFFQGTIHSDNMAFLNEADLLIRLQRSIYLMCKAKYGDDYSVIGTKCKQMECLRLAANEDDIVACLPTGYGKSLIYEALPYVEEVFRNLQVQY